MTQWIDVEGVIVGYLMPEMNDPRWDYVNCHGEILVVRDDKRPDRLWLRAVVNDVYMIDEEHEDPELNFRIGDRVQFTTSLAEQVSYGYDKEK